MYPLLCLWLQLFNLCVPVCVCVHSVCMHFVYMFVWIHVCMHAFIHVCRHSCMLQQCWKFLLVKLKTLVRTNFTNEGMYKNLYTLHTKS